MHYRIAFDKDPDIARKELVEFWEAGITPKSFENFLSYELTRFRNDPKIGNLLALAMCEVLQLESLEYRWRERFLFSLSYDFSSPSVNQTIELVMRDLDTGDDDRLESIRQRFLRVADQRKEAARKYATLDFKFLDTSEEFPPQTDPTTQDDYERLGTLRSSMDAAFKLLQEDRELEFYMFFMERVTEVTAAKKDGLLPDAYFRKIVIEDRFSWNWRQRNHIEEIELFCETEPIWFLGGRLACFIDGKTGRKAVWAYSHGRWRVADHYLGLSYDSWVLPVSKFEYLDGANPKLNSPELLDDAERSALLRSQIENAINRLDEREYFVFFASTFDPIYLAGGVNKDMKSLDKVVVVNGNKLLVSSDHATQLKDDLKKLLEKTPVWEDAGRIAVFDEEGLSEKTLVRFWNVRWGTWMVFPGR
ncbi:MAG: hypothetical protein KF851_02185 [Pirellulaceae bacterium]|nr:hypothetical protein [Pirellulaceae bacterium]